MSSRLSETKVVRCAIYTRKSTDEGLEREFNSLDAQRESAESYIKSQQHEGWTCLEARYDDGGFSGGNVERPALKRLLAHIEAGRIDCVVVYKVDRLSRSLLDFSRLMEVFDRHGVSFVSVTQQFSTTNSMGRLTLNILLSFAQFEREIISERTRDKMGAARRKGKWMGGPPVLGYDLLERRLVVNEAEAVRVRTIFELYLKQRGLVPVVQELDRRGWYQKRHVTRAGQERGGRPFTKTTLYQLLTNVTYVGQVRYRQEIFAGEHEPIVDRGLFEQVQGALREGRSSLTARQRSPYAALLKGLIRCAACNCGMLATYSMRHQRRYRYYTCSGAIKRGRRTCPTRSLPAYEVEQFVIGQLQQASHNWQADWPQELQAFERVWPTLDRLAQHELLERLVQRIEYDGQELWITFRRQETAGVHV